MEQSKWEAILTKLARWYKGETAKNKNTTGLIQVTHWYQRKRSCEDCGRGVDQTRTTTLAWRDGEWHERCRTCKLTRVRPQPFGTVKEPAREFGERPEPSRKPGRPKVEKPKKSKVPREKPLRKPAPQSQPSASVQIVENDHVIIRLYDHVSLGPTPPDAPCDPPDDQNA